jgi:hypothetical protein
MVGAFLIDPSHVCWSMIFHSAEKERMGVGGGRGLSVREVKVREGAASFSAVHPLGQDQGTQT